jgi:DNA-directed RNA polymerase specialized sigma24 family protein
MDEGNVDEEDRRAAFRAFVSEAEQRLRRGLIAAYGLERGREAASEALAYAWEHWDEIRELVNPVGFLYRVGQSRTRPRKLRWVFERPPEWEPLVEPALGKALALLPDRQRVAVFLVHGAGWTLAEVADLLEVSPSTVQRHVNRALVKLRRALEGSNDA